MKRLRSIYSLVLVSLLTGCSKGGAGEVNQKGANIFPVSAIEDGTSISMGDVMPFFDNGVMNIYHLKNISDTNSVYYHPIARISTTDFIHYVDNGVALNYEKNVTSPDAALGTGSFIKDNEGTYHAFYTGHNGMSQDISGLPYVEIIRHATSKDQVTWTKDESFNLYGWENDFRDPYVYFDNASQEYHMLITTKDAGKAVIKRYYAKSLYAGSDKTNPDLNEDNWREKDTFYINPEGNYNMECPSFLEYNGFEYLAFSEQGDNRVTHYRYRKVGESSWNRFDIDSLDSSGFYAGRLEKANDKLYAFAWCARLTGGQTGDFDWGGNLVTHELKQNADTGELYAVMPSTYKSYFSHEFDALDINENKVSSLSFSDNAFVSRGMKALSKNVTRLAFDIIPHANEKEFGVTFGIDGEYNNRLGCAAVSFDLSENKIVCYNNITSVMRYNKPLVSIPYNFVKDELNHVEIIIDGELLTCYIDDKMAVTARFVGMDENSFGFYSNRANAEIKEIKMYE